MTHRLGFLSASGLVVVGIAYAATVAVGVARAGLDDPIVDPVLAVMEIITLVSAPLIVMLMAAVHAYASPERRALGVVSLAFAILMAGTTSGVHFVTLTAGRQMGFAALQWPSVLYALELLAWDVFLGLSLLFAAPVFAGRGLELAARWFAAGAGALCLAGAVGPVIGDMAVQRIGILGYGVVLPITCFILARVFRGAGAPESTQRRPVAGEADERTGSG